MNININTGLVSKNYDMLNKANKMLLGKNMDELQTNISQTMRELSEAEV